MPLRLEHRIERLRMKAPFRISGYVFDEWKVLVVSISDGDHVGRGEASGVYYLGDDAAHMTEVVEAHRPLIQSGADREEIRRSMPRGGARNAVDCALWELEAARAGRPVWALAGLASVKPLVTTFTISADAPAAVAAKAIEYAGAEALKLKLTGDLGDDIDRVRAARLVRPDAWIGVDANQGYARAELDTLLASLVDQDVRLLEQPLPRGREGELERFSSPVPIAADESALGLDSLEGLVGRFQVVNIKLDKCGGLTEALLMAARARELGLGLMVGNMSGTSLAAAPAFVLGQLCDIIDLDGPIFLASDREHRVSYDQGRIWCGERVWGGPAAVAA